MGDIVLRQLRKEYGQVVAVSDLTLRVEEGEFMVFLGPSGCGKTTVLKLIAGLEDATSGEIAIGGKIVNFIDPGKRNVAMVFQSYALYPHMTVSKNIAFPLETARVAKQETRERITEAARMLGLTDLLGRYPAELSGGQRQRVALARAIVRKPAAFLMDEPLSNLDAQLRAQTRAELLQLHKRLQTTTVYVTHDQVEAMTMGHRIAVFRDGYLQQLGTPAEVYGAPANTFVAEFVGAPPMNIIPGVFERDGGWRFVGGALTLPLPELSPSDLASGAWASGMSGSLGVRPEHLRVTTPGTGLFDGIVQLVEPVGSDIFLVVDCGAKLVNVRTPPATRVEADERIGLAFEFEHAHFFDAAGNRISARLHDRQLPYAASVR